MSLHGAITRTVADLALRLLTKVVSHPAARGRAGNIYNLLRHDAHESYCAAAKKRYEIHPSVYWGEDTLVYGDGDIHVGEGTYFGRNSFVLAHPAGVRLSIGSHCSISHGVHIRTEKNKRKPHYRDDLASPPLGADIVIGDYVWIGANVFIGGGITIGDNSIIGANSVVTRDVPPDSICAGVPAHVVGRKDEAYAGRQGAATNSNRSIAGDAERP